MSKGNTEALKPYRFQPGNPGGPGRLPKRPISEAYEDWLRTPISSAQLAKLKVDGVTLRAGATNADMIAFSQGRKAIRGDTSAAKEMREATEGKATQRFELNRVDTRPFAFVVEYAKPLPECAPSEELEAPQAKIIDLDKEES